MAEFTPTVQAEQTETILRVLQQKTEQICAHFTEQATAMHRELESLQKTSRFLLWECPKTNIPHPRPISVRPVPAPEILPDFRFEDQMDQCRRELELFLTERKHFAQQMQKTHE